MSLPYFAEIKEYFEKNKAAMVEDLKTLCRIPSVRGDAEEGMPYGSAVHEALCACASLAERYGYSAKVYGEGGYALITLSEGDEDFGIFAHADVVHGGESWLYTTPFEPVERDGYLIGRGVRDDKGGIVNAIWCMNAIRALHIPYKKRLILFVGGNEESGMQDMESYLAAHTPPVFSLVPDIEFPACRGDKGIFRFFAKAKKPFRSVLAFEGGVSVNIVLGKATAAVTHSDELFAELSAEASDSLIVSREGDRILLTAIGLSTHGSVPQGSVNAALLLTNALLSCPHFDKEDKETLLFVKGLLDTTTGEAFSIESFDVDFGALTVSNGVVRLEDGCIKLSFDTRLGTGVDFAVLKKKIEKKLKAGDFSPEWLDEGAAKCLPKDHPMLLKCLRVASDFVGVSDIESFTAMGRTYATCIPDSLGIGVALEPHAPSDMPKGHGDVHQPDECMRIDGFIDGARLTLHMLLAL